MFHLRSLLEQSYLKQKTLSEVTSTYSGRIKLLHDLQHFKNLLLSSLYISSERKVIHYAVDISSKITVIIKASDDERCNCILVFCETAVTELFLKILSKTLLY